MKNANKLLMVLFALCISVNAYAMPPEFSNCHKESFSFDNLKYYEKKELVEGYCACKSTAENIQKRQDLNNELIVVTIKLYGTENRQYRDCKEQQKEFSNNLDMANGNASRILRILQKEHKYQDAPNCERELEQRATDEDKQAKIRNEESIKIVSGATGQFGMTAQEMTPEIAKYFGLPEKTGVIITDVKAGGPADEAGLKPRDIIVKVNNIIIFDLEKYQDALTAGNKGDALVMLIHRGKDKNLFVTLKK